MNDNIFSIDLDNIDVEDIMRQIRAKIAAKEITEEVNLELPGLEMDAEVEDNLRMANMTYNIQPHLPLHSHRKILGKGIVFGKKVIRRCLKWYINPIAEQQETFNVHAVRTLNSLSKQVEKITHAQTDTEKIIKANEKQNHDLQISQEKNLHNEINVIKDKIQDVDHLTNEFKNQIEVLEQNNQLKSQELERQVAHVIAQNEMFRQQNEMFRQQNEILKQQNNVLSARCRRIERHLKQQNISVTDSNYVAGEQEKIDFDYFLFEEQYRGSEETIRERLKVYLPYFEGRNNVLDIGCGRGEFLELLKENNVKAKGIEIDEEMLLVCAEKGLEVENVDAIAYLESLEDHSLGGIILTQVIEHLTPNYLIKLMKLAYQKLENGAYVIAETINPQSLIVFTEAYFMDLSHIKMVHPLTIKFILETEGFRNVDLKYLSPVDEELRIPMVEGMPNEFNTAVEKLNNVVYGCRDYAAIGRK